MKSAKILLGVGVLFVLLVLALQHRTIVSATHDPTGEYLAITSFKSYLSLLPMPPGSSSDKPCFVKILGKDGASLGEMPIPMCNLASVEWTATGASFGFVGAWDFEKKTCFYWSEDGNTRIYVD